ncbi:MAG: hypothetical protein ACRDOH_34960 [Streptosporangiaceae bacterium]
MIGLEPKSADLTAAEPTTILPREPSATSCGTPACTGWRPGPPPYQPYAITPATVFGTADEYVGRATRYRL